jgi:hypothetical protein
MLLKLKDAKDMQIKKRVRELQSKIQIFHPPKLLRYNFKKFLIRTLRFVYKLYIKAGILLI